MNILMEELFMIDRLILSAVLGSVGFNGLLPPDPPVLLTAQQLQAKAKKRQLSELCAKKKKSKKVREICAEWERTNA